MGKLGIITDFDNTLVRTYNFVVDHITLTCNNEGIAPPTEEEIIKILKTNPPFEDIFTKLFGEKGVEILAKYRETAMDTPYKPVEDGAQAIQKLKKANVNIVIVSNRINKLSDRLTQAGYNADDFTIIQPETPKPSQDAYKEALAHLETQGVGRENVYIIGDSLDDYLACPDDLSKRFYGVSTGLNTKEEFIGLKVNPANVLSGIEELPGKLL